MFAWVEDRLFTLARRIVVNVLARESEVAPEIIYAEIAHMETTLAYRQVEQGVVEAMLTRRFDPGPIWNAAINRAIERKKAAKEDVHWTGYQERAFEVQQETTRSALRNA